MQQNFVELEEKSWDTKEYLQSEQLQRITNILTIPILSELEP